MPYTLERQQNSTVAVAQRKKKKKETGSKQGNNGETGVSGGISAKKKRIIEGRLTLTRKPVDRGSPRCKDRWSCRMPCIWSERSQKRAESHKNGVKEVGPKHRGLGRMEL